MKTTVTAKLILDGRGVKPKDAIDELMSKVILHNSSIPDDITIHQLLVNGFIATGTAVIEYETELEE